MENARTERFSAGPRSPALVLRSRADAGGRPRTLDYVPRANAPVWEGVIAAMAHHGLTDLALQEFAAAARPTPLRA